MNTTKLDISQTNQHSQTTIAYQQWLIDNGCELDKVWLSAVFNSPTDQMRGMAAKQSIQKGQTVFRISNKVMIGAQNLQQHEMKDLYSKHEELFDDDYNLLIVFILQEKHKAKQSFYYPLIQYLKDYDVNDLTKWSVQQIEELQDINMFYYQEQQREELFTLYEQMNKDIFKVEGDRFGIVSYDDLCWAYHVVSSRCFGYYVPNETMILPIADNINHDLYASVKYYTIHEGLEKDQQLAEEKHYKQKRPRIYQADKYDEEETDIKVELNKVEEVIEQDKWDYDSIDETDEEDDDEEEDSDSDSSESDQEIEREKQRFDKTHVHEIWFRENVNQQFTEKYAKQILERHKKIKNRKERDYQNQLKNRKKRNQKKEETEVEEEIEQTYIQHIDQKVQDIEEFSEDSEDLDLKENDTLQMKLMDQFSQQLNDEINKINQRHQNEQQQSDDEQQQQSDDESDATDDSNYEWYDQNDPEVFIEFIASQDINQYSQLINSYGSRSNSFLLQQYGFRLPFNKYDSVKFRLMISPQIVEQNNNLENLIIMKDITPLDQELKFVVHNGQKVEQISRIFGLKYNQINLNLLIILRLMFRNAMKPTEKIRFGVAFQPDYEIVVIQNYLRIVKFILNKFKTTMEEDQLILEQPLDFTYKQAVIYRLGLKRILRQQIRYCQLILNILNQYKQKGKLKEVMLQQFKQFREKGEERLLIGIAEYFRFNGFQ